MSNVIDDAIERFQRERDERGPNLLSPAMIDRAFARAHERRNGQETTKKTEDGDVTPLERFKRLVKGEQ